MNSQGIQKVLFLRKYERRTGGHVTVRDYFLHSLHHPRLDPYVYFTSNSDLESNDLWLEIPRERIVTEPKIENYDVLFIGGDDWNLLPGNLAGKKVINVILHVRHARRPELRSFLQRPAYRICNSHEVGQAIAPFVNGPAEVIHNAVDFDLFVSDAPQKPNSILIWGQKNPPLANKLAEALKETGHDVYLLLESVPRKDFAGLLSLTDIFVPLPHRTEGFYRPSLEGMAGRCAVICSDAKGNRCHCIDMETCLQPNYDDFEDHLAKIYLLLNDPELKERIRATGYEVAQKFTLTEQRRRYYLFFDKYIL